LIEAITSKLFLKSPAQGFFERRGYRNKLELTPIFCGPAITGHRECVEAGGDVSG